MKAIDTRTALGAALFTVAPALLASVTPTLALACLPLLASLFALRRGHSWGAFALLGGATCLAAMGITQLLPWPAALASGGALLTCGVVVPHLWRFDKAATAIVMALTMGLGVTAGALVENVRPDATTACQSKTQEPSTFGRQGEDASDLQMADLVGVYVLQSEDASLTLNAIGGVSLETAKTLDGETAKTLDGQFFKGRKGRLEIVLGDTTVPFVIGDGVLIGPNGEQYHLAGAVR